MLEVVGIERNDDEVVIVRLRLGDKEATESFPYVIAADGAKGPLSALQVGSSLLSRRAYSFDAAEA